MPGSGALLAESGIAVQDRPVAVSRQDKVDGHWAVIARCAAAFISYRPGSISRHTPVLQPDLKCRFADSARQIACAAAVALKAVVSVCGLIGDGKVGHVDLVGGQIGLSIRTVGVGCAAEEGELIAVALTVLIGQVAGEVPPLCLEGRVGAMILGKGKVNGFVGPIKSLGVCAAQRFDDVGARDLCGRRRSATDQQWEQTITGAGRVSIDLNP